MVSHIEDKDNLKKMIIQAIELLCEKNLSSVVILSSYKINAVLKENYGVDIKADKIGRVLSNLAKRNNLKRLNTNIPKYQLYVSKFASLQF